MRMTRYRRTPLLTPLRAVLIIAVIIIAALIAFNQYYRYVQRPFWDEQAVVMDEAIRAGLIKEADRAVKYVWDETVWIIHGKDEAGEEVFVWMPQPQAEDDANKDASNPPSQANDASKQTANRTDAVSGQTTAEPVVVKLSEGVSKERLKEALSKSRADAKIEHIKLGYKDGDPAWEVFYTKNDSYYYDFFRFSDGALLVTYSLPKQ